MTVEQKNTDATAVKDDNNTDSALKSIWDYVPLPDLSIVSPKEMFRSNKLRFGTRKNAGSSAENRVRTQIEDSIGWAVSKEESQSCIIDLFAVSLQPPYKIAYLQVKSSYEGSRTIHVDAKHLEFDIGPVWVIQVETKPKQFAYLVFSHPEFKKYVTENARYYGLEQGYKKPEWDFSMPPKKLKHPYFENHVNQWEKIEKNSKVYLK